MKPLRAILPVVACLTTAVPIPASAASSIRTVDEEGTGSVTVSLSGQRSPMLNTFRLRFTNGDHHVRKIAIEPANGWVRASLTDKNADDPIAFDGRFIHVDHSRAHTVERVCTGVCTIPIEQRAGSGMRLYLAGFSLERLDGADSNIRKVAIQPVDNRAAYRVEMRDNGTFPYRVRIHYGWFIGGAGHGTVRVFGHRLPGQRTQAIKMGRTSTSSRSVLQGFSFEFINGDHHLRDIAVHQGDDSQYRVRFNDNNYDDPVRASLDVVFVQ